MKKTHAYFMNIAIQMSKKSVLNNLTGGPFGCVIVKDKQVVGRGRNLVLKKNDPTLHGEIVAIQKACKRLKTVDLSDCILYTSCEPCPMCLMACKWANIKKIYFAATRQDAEKIGFRDAHLYSFLKKHPRTGVHMKKMEDKAVKAMLQWQERYPDAHY